MHCTTLHRCLCFKGKCRNCLDRLLLIDVLICVICYYQNLKCYQIVPYAHFTYIGIYTNTQCVGFKIYTLVARASATFEQRTNTLELHRCCCFPSVFRKSLFYSLIIVLTKYDCFVLFLQHVLPDGLNLFT